MTKFDLLGDMFRKSPLQNSAPSCFAKCFVFLLTIGTLTNCTDDRSATPTPLTNPIEVQMTGSSDVSFGLDAWANLSDQERQAARRLMRDPTNASGVQIAIAENELPGRAAAIVIRDPGKARRRTLVVGKGSLDEEILALGSTALIADEAANPDLTERRLLRVGRDGRVTEPTGTEVMLDRARPRMVTPAGWLNKLLGTASSKSVVEIDGIGPVQLFRFD